MFKIITSFATGIYIGQEITDVPRIKPFINKAIKDVKTYVNNIDEKK